jgi:hypothetical protein
MATVQSLDSAIAYAMHRSVRELSVLSLLNVTFLSLHIISNLEVLS